jgi:uncharacterized protein (DUF1810 family)
MITLDRRRTPTMGRFRAAQDHKNTYARALREIRRGDKQTHWMWFIFPQLRGLARSETAWHFGLADKAEAVAYLEDPALRMRLAECATAVLRHDRIAFLSSVDQRKLRSSMTLFGQVAKDPALANAVLAKFFDGQPDQFTLDLLAGKTITLPVAPPPRPAVGGQRQAGIQRARGALLDAERRRREGEPWTRDRVATFAASFGLSTVAARQMADAWMVDRQRAMKKAWEACADSFDYDQQSLFDDQ